MVRALESTFPSVSIKTDGNRRRWWKLRDTTMLGMRGIYDRELVALEMAIRRAEREGARSEVEALQALRGRLIATLPSSQARRAEVDAEAVLEAQGYACRSGPKVKTSPMVTGAIAEALKAPFSLTIRYQGKQDAEPRDRTVEPYGMLLGTRHYLIARDPSKGSAFRRFRMDRIMSHQADGGLIVTFRASGWVEMVWHLCKWGGAVEVLDPPELREIVARHPRENLGPLP